MKIKNFELKYTNNFLIPLDLKYLLIDTGYEWEWEKFQNKLRDLNINISDIDYLLLTHTHDDHVGLINKLIEFNPKIKIIASQKAKNNLKQGINYSEGKFYWINKKIKFILKIKSKFNKNWTHFPVFIMRDSDILIYDDINFKEIGININGKIIITPGHSDDSISVLLDDGSCFCGDAASNFFQFLGTRYCGIAVRNLDEYYKSWIKMINENAKIIYPSHGKAFKVECLQKNLYKNKNEDLSAW